MNFTVYGGLPEGEKARLVNLLMMPSDIRYRGRLITERPKPPAMNDIWADRESDRVLVFAQMNSLEVWIDTGIKASSLILWERPKETR
jgi:hypothetical protein